MITPKKIPVWHAGEHNRVSNSNFYLEWNSFAFYCIKPNIVAPFLVWLCLLLLLCTTTTSIQIVFSFVFVVVVVVVVLIFDCFRDGKRQVQGKAHWSTPVPQARTHPCWNLYSSSHFWNAAPISSASGGWVCVDSASGADLI